MTDDSEFNVIAWSLPTHDDLNHYDRAELQKDLTTALLERIPMEGILSSTKVKDGMREITVADQLFGALRPIMRNRTGSWFLGVDYAHPEGGWCVCHKFLPRDQIILPSDVPAAINSLLSGIDLTHCYFFRLRQFCDETAKQGTDKKALPQLKENIQKMIRLTVELTECDSSWYLLAAENITFLIQELQLSENEEVMEAFKDEIEALIEAKFKSWISPSSEDIESISTQVEIDALKRLFDENYQ